MPTLKKSYGMAESGTFGENLRLNPRGAGPLDVFTFAA